MTARDDILRRVRAGVRRGAVAQGGVSGDDRTVRRAAAEALLVSPRRGPQPLLAGDLAARFKARAESLASTVESLAERSAAPAAVARYLVEQGLPPQVVVAPELAGLPWAAAGLHHAARGAVDADTAGVTGCFCAVAETGTLVLLSGPATPATVSLLPETHVALLDAARIVATMEDAFVLLRAEQGMLPRAVNFISGPSRTGDIEQTIVLGAHGPCRVHIVVIG